MKYYNLIVSASNQIITLIEWDDVASGSISASITPPSGTYFYEVNSGSVFTSSTDYDSYSTLGEFGGAFSGSINASSISISNNALSLYPSTVNNTTVIVLLTGSMDVSGSIFASNISGSFTGSFYGKHTGFSDNLSGSFNGILIGTASHAIFADSASVALSASTIAIFTTSSNWTKPTWAKTVKVVLVGGGGAGGSAYGPTGGQPTPGAGGGGGGSVTIMEFDAATLPTSSIAVFVGGGGYKGQNGNDGGNGGDSQFGKYALARGGQGGQGYLTTGPKPLHYDPNTYPDGLRLGGGTLPSINFTNTGGGAGGMGTYTEYTQIIFEPNDLFVNWPCCIAPPLPYPEQYLLAKPLYLTNGSRGWNGTLNIPAVIAPTGGGGGTGYDPSNGGNQSGDTSGGKIKPTSFPYATQNGEAVLGITPSEIYGSSISGNREFNAFNTKIGLGGTGGVSSTSQVPTTGTNYGGGGGGAYGGGTQYSSDPFESTYNDGADGAPGVVVIISEA